MCSGSRITAEEVEAAVRTYGRTIATLPEEGLRLIDSVEIQNRECPAWSVVVPLFTREEGLSDLSLELTLTETHAGVVSIELDDLRVLWQRVAQQIRICRGPPATYPVVEQARRVRGDLSIRN